MKTFLLTLVLLLPLPLLAGDFVPLVGIPGVTDAGAGFGEYLNSIYALSISIAALLAVIKIIVAGVKWMMTDVVTSKGDAKKDIEGAVLGLIVVIAAVLILTVINPQLTTFTVFNFEAAPNPAERAEEGGVETTPAVTSAQTCRDIDPESGLCGCTDVSCPYNTIPSPDLSKCRLACISKPGSKDPEETPGEERTQRFTVILTDEENIVYQSPTGPVSVPRSEFCVNDSCTFAQGPAARSACEANAPENQTYSRHSYMEGRLDCTYTRD